MKNRLITLLVLAILSLLSGILISKMSFIGKVGITLIYNEYTIFKSWWQTALVMFIIQLIIFGILSFSQHKKQSKFKRSILPILFILIGVAGFYYTYYDFTETSHRLMKKSFHFGFYLFWMTWFINCFFFFSTKPKQITPIGSNEIV